MHAASPRMRYLSYALLLLGVGLIVYGCLYRPSRTARQAILQHYVQYDRGNYHTARRELDNNVYPMILRSVLILIGVMAIAVALVWDDRCARRLAAPVKPNPSIIPTWRRPYQFPAVVICVVAALMGFALQTFLFALRQMLHPHGGSVLTATGERLLLFELVLWAWIAVMLGLLVRRWFLTIMWRRLAQGYCPYCRYDLRGNSSGATCPECGAALTPNHA